MTGGSTTSASVAPEGSVVCVVGLGYVGVPLSLAFDEAGFDVVGYDVDEAKVQALASGTNVAGDQGDEAVAASDVEFTADPSRLERADYVIVTVPTPVDEAGTPNLEFVAAAGRTVGEHISRGATVVLESTVYPGATWEVLAPAVAEASGFEPGEGFHIGYSPERLSPGQGGKELQDVVKLVGGSEETVGADLAALYETVVDAGVHRTPSIEVAEAAKVIENVQRDLNIAFVNELAVICEYVGLDVDDVLEAAGTKWNFHDYTPGLVGGHCIPVDPLYLAHAAQRAGYRPDLILAGRAVNEAMSGHVAELAIKALNRQGKVLQESELLVVGLAYKPNVGDVRNSEVRGVVAALEEFGVDVVGHDPHAADGTIREHFGIDVQPALDVEGFDGVVLAMPHEAVLPLDLQAMAGQLADDPVLVDVFGVVKEERAKAAGMDYRTL